MNETNSDTHDKNTNKPHPRQPIVQLSWLSGHAVVTRSGESVGLVEDVIVQLSGTSAYPPVTGLVVTAGGRSRRLPADQIEFLERDRITLRENRIDLHHFERAEGEILLGADLLHHRLVDVPAAELVHAYDFELERTSAGWVLARLDTHRMGRFFGLFRSSGGQDGRDWTAFEPLVGRHRTDVARHPGSGLSTLRPAQIADLLEDADKSEGGQILERIHHDPELEADVFEELEPDRANKLLDDMSDSEVAGVLTRMRADDAADTIAELRQARRRRVLDLMPAEQGAQVLTLLAFNPWSAGGLMSVDVASCRSTNTAAQALSVIATSPGMQQEALSTVHVESETGRLTGVVSAVRLIQSGPRTPITELMDSDPVRVAPETDLTDVALLMADFNLVTLPVVDGDDRVVGVVTVDDVLEAVVPEDWRRREPTPRPVHGGHEPASAHDSTGRQENGSGGERHD